MPAGTEQPPGAAPAPAAAAAGGATDGMFLTLDARPEGIEDGWWDEEGKRLRVADLLAAATDREGQKTRVLAELRRDVPAEPAGYDFAPDPALTKGATFDPADPMLAKAREVMHRIGASPSDWKELTDAYVASAVSAVPDMAAEMAKMGDGAQARIAAITGRVRAGLPADQAAAVLASCTTAEAVLGLERLLANGAGGDGAMVPAVGGGQAMQTTLTPAEAMKIQSDPNYWKANPAGEAARQRFRDFIAGGGKLPGME